MLQNFIIYSKMIEVLAWLFPKVNSFPKKQRFVLGQQLETSALNCLRLIIEANNARGANAKLAKLESLNTELEMLRALLRVAHELQFLTAKSLAFITQQVDEVGKMRGGWAKRYQRPSK